MSENQRKPGEPSAGGPGATAPAAETIAARLTGGGEPRTAYTGEGGGGGRGASSEPETSPDAGEGARSTEPAGRREAGAAASGTGAAAGSGESRGEQARNSRSGGSTAEESGNSGAGSGGSTTGESRNGEAGGGQGGGAAEGRGARGIAAGSAGQSRGVIAAAVTGRSRGVAATAAAGGQGRGATATAAAAGAGGDAPGSGEGGSGRPRKPLLAGAAMAGAILIAVPLLIMATGNDEEKKKVANTSAADSVLGQDGEPAGAFVAESPSPTATKPKAKSPSPTQTAPEKPGKQTKGSSPSAAAKGPSSVPGQPAVAPGPEPRKKTAASGLPAVTSRVLIKNNSNGTCVDIPTAGGRRDGPVHHSTCNSNTDDNQLWNVEKRYDSAGPGGVPLFQIRNVSDGMCLDLPGTKAAGSDTRVTQSGCAGTTKDNQMWWLDKRADGKFWIRNAASADMCLDSYGRDEKRRELMIWPCAPESRNNHMWIFTRS
ncbi:RICIN domain-containing protein [Streptomyces sp. NPDC004838]